MRAPFAALLAVALAGAGMSAAYADKTTTGFNSGDSGVVVSRSTPGSTLSGPNILMLSQCEYTTAPTPGGVQVVLTGSASAVPLGPGETPSSTTITCEVNNFAAGGTDMMTSTATMSGAMATTSRTVPLSDGRPLTVCVTSSATSTSGTVSNPRVCEPPDLVGGGGGFAQCPSGSIGQEMTVLGEPSTNTYVYLHRPPGTPTDEYWLCFRTPSAPLSPDGTLIVRSAAIPRVELSAPTDCSHQVGPIVIANLVSVTVAFTAQTYTVCLSVNGLPGLQITATDPFPQPTYYAELWVDGHQPVQIGLPE